MHTNPFGCSLVAKDNQRDTFSARVVACVSVQRKKAFWSRSLKDSLQTSGFGGEAVSLDSTSIKVHPDGTGVLKKTAHCYRQVPQWMEHQDS